MRLSELYDYVFGERAIIVPNQRLANEAARNAYIQKKQSEIRNAFKFLTDPATDHRLRTAFLEMLSSLQIPSADALRSILFGDEKAEVKAPHDYNDESIKRKFEEINTQFKYFSGEESNKAQDDFVVFYKACKLVGDFIECNNDADNTLASDLAYKMLVVFGAAHGKNQSLFANVDAYLKEHCNQQAKPVHDALVLPIPVNEPPLQNLAAWRKLISKHGRRALEYFQEAPAIESKLAGKAPVTIDEVREIAAQLTFPRANEYPELARLGKRFHLSESIFNQCLEVEKKRKQKDQLPDIQVDGKEVGHEGYYLVKLPIDDPRAYLLGHITNCCQSMGGNSEECVIDGITREKNGFYVLLKQKKKNNSMPIENNKINYEAFDIVGQGYAWLSRKGNLVFDSWENLRPKQHNEVIFALLVEFAKKVTEQCKILRVTIGTGGKTPDEFKKNQQLRVAHPEMMAEGFQYGDSEEQALVYINWGKYYEAREALLSKNDKFHSSNSASENYRAIRELLYTCHYSSYQDFIQMESLFLNPEIADIWKDQSLLNHMTQQIGENPALLDGISWLHRHHLLTEEGLYSLSYVIEHATRSFVNILEGLPLEVISKENFNLLIRYSWYAEDIGAALSILYRANPQLVNDENFKQLINESSHGGQKVAKALDRLYNLTPELVNTTNFELIISSGGCAEKMSIALKNMYLLNRGLMTDENLACLKKRVVFADHIAYALAALHETNPQLVNDENLKLLTNQAAFAKRMSEALVVLYNTDQNLVNENNRALLAKQAGEAKEIASALVTLHQADPLLVNDINRQLLIANLGQAKKVVRIIAFKHKLRTFLENHSNKLIVAGVAVGALIIVAVGIFFAPGLLALPFISQACAAILAATGIAVSAKVIVSSIIAAASIVGAAIGGVITRGLIAISKLISKPESPHNEASNLTSAALPTAAAETDPTPSATSIAVAFEANKSPLAQYGLYQPNPDVVPLDENVKGRGQEAQPANAPRI